jgi:hypothetical protein
MNFDYPEGATPLDADEAQTEIVQDDGSLVRTIP